jgi:ubiquinone/menaquinone biosynthesis C-methylase UbiE
MTASSSCDHYLLGEEESAFRRYRLFNQVYQPATAERLATLRLAPDMNILEVGCGIGDTACYMARAIVPEGQVTAFDQSADLVAVAREQASAAGIDNVTFVCAKAQEFDYEQERFDLAHTRYVLSYSPDARRIVEKVYGALKPAGIFFGEEIAQIYVKHDQPKWFDELTGWFARLIEAGGGMASYGLDRMPWDMLTAGFQDLHVTAYCPIEDQAKIVEMLRLALSREMRDTLIEHQIAAADDIDAALAAMHAPGGDFLISASMVAQVIGRKPRR